MEYRIQVVTFPNLVLALLRGPSWARKAVTQLRQPAVYQRFHGAISACARYAHFSSRPREEVVVPPPAAQPSLGPDQETSTNRTTLRFPSHRPPGSLAKSQKQNLVDPRHRQKWISQRPAKQPNVSRPGAGSDHPADRDGHLTREEVPLFRVPPLSDLPLVDPNVDVFPPLEGREQNDRDQRAELMRQAGLDQEPEHARENRAKREEARQRWVDNIAAPVQQTRQRRAGDDVDEDNDNDDDGGGKTGGYALTTRSLRLASALNSFEVGEDGLNNPLCHLFTLLAPFYVEYTGIIVKVFNDYVREITADVRLVEIWRHRVMQPNGGWLEIARQIAHFLAAEPNQLNVDNEFLLDTCMPYWKQLAGTGRGNFEANLRSYCREYNPLAGDVGAVLASRSTNAQYADPAFLKVVSVFRQNWTQTNRPPLAIDGLTSSNLWLTSLKSIGLSLGKKVLSANMRSALEKIIKDRSEAVQGGGEVDADKQEAVCKGILATRRSELQGVNNEAAALTTWGRTLLDQAGIDAVTQHGLMPWMLRVGRALLERVPISPANSSLDEIILAQDDNIRVQEAVPFFVALGMDIALVCCCHFQIVF